MAPGVGEGAAKGRSRPTGAKPDRPGGPTYEDFLGLYTLVSPDFIHAFYAFFEKRNGASEFTVDLDKATKWLGRDRRALLEVLSDSYIEGADFITKESRAKPRHGGNNKKLVLLKVETFKLLAMRSKTKEAEGVRQYFLRIEKFLMDHHQVISVAMQKEVHRAWVAMKRGDPEKDDGGFVYGIRSSVFDRRLTKVGHTVDAAKMMAKFNAGHVEKAGVRFIYHVDKRKAVARCIKEVLRRDRQPGATDVLRTGQGTLRRVFEGCEKLSWTLRYEAPGASALDEEVMLVVLSAEDVRKAIEEQQRKRAAAGA